MSSNFRSFRHSLVRTTRDSLSLAVIKLFLQRLVRLQSHFSNCPVIRAPRNLVDLGLRRFTSWNFAALKFVSSRICSVFPVLTVYIVHSEFPHWINVVSTTFSRLSLKSHLLFNFSCPSFTARFCDHHNALHCASFISYPLR